MNNLGKILVKKCIRAEVNRSWMVHIRREIGPIFALILVMAAGLPAYAIEIANPGFEQELGEWVLNRDNGMTTVLPEAARTGKLGLRVTDKDPKQGSGAISLEMSVEPGSKYKLSAWGRGVDGTGGVGLYLRFLDDRGKPVAKPKAVVVPSSAREWTQYTLEAVAPEGATAVDVWIHSLASDMPVVDIDDLELTMVTP